MSETIFERILAGEIPADKVYEDQSVLAFRDIQPQAPVHVLVIPKKRMDRFEHLHEWGPEETGCFFQAVSRVAEELGLTGRGYRVVVNNGSDGGQEVEYLHAHILGGRSLSWPAG